MSAQKRHWLHTVHWGHLGYDDPGTLEEFMKAMNEWIENLTKATTLRYLCGQVEKCPDTGRLHGQMYTEWKKSLRFGELLKIAPSDLEYRKGTRTEARDYVTSAVWKGKDKGKVADLPAYGEWRPDSEASGKKTTQKEQAIHYILEGLTPQEISWKDPLVYFTHHYAIHRLWEARNGV